MSTYTISKTPQATLNRLASMARTARTPAAPPQQRMSFRDQRMRDAQARDAHERFVACDTLRTMNLRNQRFWDSAGEHGLPAGFQQSEEPPGMGKGAQSNVGVGSLESMIAGARSGSDTLAHSTPFDPIADLGRKGSGAPMGDLPLASQNAMNAHHWKLPQEKRSDFLTAVRQAHMNGHDISPAGIARLAEMFG